MSSRVLVLDAVATNRIVMTSKLSAAHYAVTAWEMVSDPEQIATLPAAELPDVIVLDANLSRKDGIDLCAAIKGHTETKHIPIMMTLPADKPELANEAFAVGVDDVLIRPLNEQVLLARLRNLIRDRVRARALETNGTGFEQRNDDVGRGFEDIRAGFVSTHSNIAQRNHAYLQASFEPKLDVIGWSEIFEASSGDDSLDLIIISADVPNARDPLNLICDLRSRGASRDAGIVLVTGPGPEDPALVAEALNTGANDVLPFDTPAPELRARLFRQIALKRREDGLRARIQSGLRLATTDALTGLHNRRYAENFLDIIAQKTREAETNFALLMVDVDHFKSINDRFGHGTGDRVLQRISALLHSNLRDTDLLARIGGEEFLIALPQADEAVAMSTADRLRLAVGADPLFETPDDKISVTISIGMTISDGTTAIETLIHEADCALYAAKADGRNTISIGRAAA